MKDYFKQYRYLIGLFLLCSCSSDPDFKYEKTPLDNIISQYLSEPNYSVILADMDYNEAEDKYLHKYRIILEKPIIKVDSIALNDTLRKAEDIKIINTDWKKVNPIFFEDHIEDLGMTILSKKDGKLDKVSSPAGMDNYVGNKRYGNWQTNSNGSSFWAFYGQYYFMSRMLGGVGYSRNSWNDYDRNYRGNKPYYGSGDTKYGSSSSRNKNSTWSKKPNTFKSNVRSKVKQSSTAMKSRGYSSSSSYSKKTSRNSSRYSSSSSSRSRGGGSGK